MNRRPHVRTSGVGARANRPQASDRDPPPKLNQGQGWLMRIVKPGDRLVLRVGKTLIAVSVERSTEDYAKLWLDIPPEALVGWTADDIARVLDADPETRNRREGD